jgi:hypothetical protein
MLPGTGRAGFLHDRRNHPVLKPAQRIIHHPPILESKIAR